MVNGIGFNNIAYPKKDVETLAKFAMGVPLTNDQNKLKLSNVASYPLMLASYEGLGWLKKNKGNYKNAFQEVTNTGKETFNILKNTGAKGVLRVADAKEILASIPDKEYLSKLSASTQNLYSQAQQLAEVAKNSPASKTAVKNASSTLAKATSAAYSETVKGTTGLKKALGLTKFSQGVKDLSVKSPGFKKCVDAYNNEAGTLMLLLEGGVETATNVVPTFKKLGAKKGFKQLGRSAAKTVASVAGWVAGSAVGTKLGQVAGAAIGNQKIGAVIGAMAGEIGSYAAGTVGQHLSTKLADKALGKSELEKAQEEQAIALAEEAQNNPEVFAGLVEAAANRIAAEGDGTAEFNAVNESLMNLAQAEQVASGNTLGSTSPMMSREEMAEYAKKLQDSPQSQDGTQVAQAPQQTYIPSSAPVQLSETAQPEIPANIKNLLDTTDKMLDQAAKALK